MNGILHHHKSAAHTPLPLVGVTSCVRNTGLHDFHMAGEKYLMALLRGARVMPVILPALLHHQAEEDTDILTTWLAHLDGVLLTGSPSDVEPQHYEGGFSRPDQLHDPRRDATNLPLIRAAVAAKLPLFGICRGIQEINVAMGGTLFNQVHAIPGRMAHQDDESRGSVEERYGPAHEITLVQGGWLHQMLGEDTTRINSLHHQGVDQIGQGLVVEAVAPDGQIEALRVADSGDVFQIGVQWHPEWLYDKSAINLALFRAFGESVRTHQAARLRQAKENERAQWVEK